LPGAVCHHGNKPTVRLNTFVEVLLDGSALIFPDRIMVALEERNKDTDCDQDNGDEHSYR
jgi:hypothetical protein